MSLDVISALELDKGDMAGKFLLIKEWSGSEATFLISCLLSKEIKDGRAVCLVLLHGDVNHYHNISLKLGYNLKLSIEKGSVIIIDILSKIKNDPVLEITETDSVLSGSKIFLKNLYLEIEKLVSLNSVAGLTIMFDGFTHLLDLGYSIELLNLLVHNLRSLITEHERCALVINTHLCSDESIDTILSNILHYLSDIVCEVTPLATGLSSHVSGHLKLIKKGPMLESLERLHHFKLLDRGIKVFSPGV